MTLAKLPRPARAPHLASIQAQTLNSPRKTFPVMARENDHFHVSSV